MKREDFKGVTKHDVETAKHIINFTKNVPQDVLVSQHAGLDCDMCPLHNLHAETGYNFGNSARCLDPLKEFVALFEKDFETPETDKNTGIKHDSGKARWDLLPFNIWNWIVELSFVFDGSSMLNEKFVENEDWCLLAANIINEYNVELKDIVRIYTEGAKKYGDWNWTKLENPKPRFKAALCRHLLEVNPNDINPDFGIKHAAHAVWCCIALKWLELNR